MFRTFIFGLLLGFGGAGAFLHLVPLVDQHREQSHILVQPNGANLEVFSIDLPGDRIMSGVQGAAAPAPAGLDWPDSPAFAGFQAEVFKIRDRDGTVVGTGSRMLRSARAGEPFVQWVVHLPARGTLFVAMEPNPPAGQERSGIVSAGTREFEPLRGSVSEVFVRSDQSGDSESEGRIELRVALVASQETSE